MTNDDPYADVTPADSAKRFRDILEDKDFIELTAPEIAQSESCVDFELPLYDFSSGARVKTGGTFRLERARD